MIFQQSEWGGWGEWRVFGVIPNIPLIRPSGTFSLEGEGFVAFGNSGFCNSGQTLRAEWHEGVVRVEEESSSLKYAATNGTIRSALVQYSAHESIKTHCWWYQSIISACSVNSYFKQHQHQYADNKINAQSINSQCTEHLQAIHKASASNECKINISALSININAKSIKSQCTEHQHPKHSVFISKADSDSVQCTLCQQPLNATLTSMRSSSTSMLRVSTANADITRLPYARFL